MEQKTKDLIDALSSGPVKQYLIEHEHHAVRDVILNHKEILGVPTSTLFEQLSARKKARQKLPLYYETEGIVYPAQQNWEQSSSQQTAELKSEIVASLVGTRAVIADLTGGFGVDTLFFSRKVGQVHYVEPNKELLELAQHNHQLLGARNIEYHNDRAEDFLEANQSFDLLYIDPSRRTEDKKKVLTFEHSAPDVSKLAGKIFDQSEWLFVKASPMLDIHAGFSQLPFVKRVFVVSVRNECKEVLFLAQKRFDGTAEIEAVNLTPDHVEHFTFTISDEETSAVSYSDPLTFLYEPNASILKAGAFKSVANRFGLKKIHVNTHLYTSNELVVNFPGKKFRIEAFVKPDKIAMKGFFPDGKANVTTRNYPMSAEALKKKTRLNDGGEKFLIAFSGMSRKFVAVAQRL